MDPCFTVVLRIPDPDATAQGGSSVQFAAPGATVYVAVHDPAALCQDNPLLVTSCDVPGDQLTDENAARDVLVGLEYDWGNDNTNAPVDNHFGSWQVDENGTTNDPYHVSIRSGRYWVRTSGLCRVKAALFR